MKQQFIDHKFTSTKIAMIEKITDIMDAYRDQGFVLSLRQLYYQLVARGIIENSQRSYKIIGNLVSVGRQAGMFDWAMIEDRNRNTDTNSHWSSTGSIIRSAAQSYRIDLWVGQPCHIEVMVEKDALSGVLGPVCKQLDIGITANKGYCSSSTMYEVGRRLHDKHNTLSARGELTEIIILYLGDHDPSGIDMTRDIRERLCLYSGVHQLEVVRLALNWDQVAKWQPPKNPAKQTDSRFKAYSKEFGDSSWELDAVEPATLAGLVQAEVQSRIDIGIWHERVLKEEAGRKELFELADKY